MRKFPRQLLVEALENAGFDKDNIYDNYSGRGMNGSTCPGVTVDHESDLRRIMFELARVVDGAYEEFLDVAEDMTGGAMDNMGRGWILYWPGVTLVDEMDGEL